MSVAPELQNRLQDVEAIVIGASAGGVLALLTILPQLPDHYKLPIFVVVHQPADKSSSITELFRSRCAARVKEAEDKEPITPGTIYFAPPDYHLLIEMDGVISLSNEEPVNFSRPAVDLLFESAADAFGSGLLAIVLTGANEDGAQGIRVVCDADGVALVQSPETAEARAMPEAALKSCDDAIPMPLESIVEAILSAG